MKRYFQFAMIVFVFVIFTGCAPKALTNTEKESIKSLTIHSPTIEKDAFFKVDGSGQSNVQDSVGMAGGGLIPSLIGALIDSSIKSSQRSKFEGKYPEQIKKINSVDINNIEKEVETRILNSLKEDNFFSLRLSEDATNYFDCKIISYGLTRSIIESKTDYLEANLNLEVFFINENGEKVFSQYINTKSSEMYSVDELAKNDKLVTMLYTQAFDNFGYKFSEFLDLKLGRIQ